MRRLLLASYRLFLPICTLLFVALVFGSPASATNGNGALWGPQADEPVAKVADANYVASQDASSQCHDQDFVLSLAKDDQYYQQYRDTTYTQCAFYTDYGLVSTGQILYLNDSLQPYHVSVLSITGSIVPTPNAHSLFIRGGSEFIAYDHPQKDFRIKAGTDYLVLDAAYKQEYYLQDGVTPRILKDSKGQPIQNVKRTKISQNGDWLILERGTQLYRVRADDFTDLLAFPGDPLFHGQDPNDDMAISNDGRYVALVSNDHLNFKLYDLSTCVPNTNYNLTNATGCQPLYMVDKLSQLLGETVNFVSQPSFSADGSRLSINVSVGTGATKHAELVELVAPGAQSSAETTLASNYIALGDSYASGEGAFNYYSGTDETANKCHLSRESYPYLLGLKLQLDSVHSVACSGAKMINVNGSGSLAAQYSLRPYDAFSNDWLPGYAPQLQYIQQQQPNIVTISMVGNDVGFSDIIKHCVIFGNCYSSYEERMGLVLDIDSKFDSLVTMYAQIKAADPDSRVYVIGYPDIVSPDGNCGLNVHMSQAETEFATNLENYLDSVIELAADKAGVSYVDTAGAFAGSRLCDGNVTAVNGLTAGNDALGVIGQESYHPTAFGHQLLALEIATRTNGFTQPNPSPIWGMDDPDSSGAADFIDAPSSGEPIRKIEFDDEGSVVQQSPTIGGSLVGDQYHLSPQSSYEVWIHSTPVKLDTVTTDPDGNLQYDAQIPGSIEPGWHTIDVYGDDISGQAVDIQRLIYIPTSSTDWDGDGVPNGQEPCGLFAPSGIDVDGDGIDDACDAIIGIPQAGSKEAPSDSGAASTHQNLSGGQATKSGSGLQPSISLVDDQVLSTNTIGIETSQSGKVLGVQSLGSAVNKPSKNSANSHTRSNASIKLPIELSVIGLLVAILSWMLVRRRPN